VHYSVNRMSTLLVLAAFCGISSAACAQSGEMTKRWSFQGKNATVEIELTQFPHGEGPTSLQIFSQSESPRSVAEEAEFLATVLDSLPKMGTNAQSLDFVILRLNESEAIDRVASCAAASKQWRPALRAGSTAATYKLVTAFLNDCRAYREWDRIFAAHGLTLKVAGVEKVILEPFSKTAASCPPGAECTRLRVPTDALVQINIETANHP
jgi:hypothetical protein